MEEFQREEYITRMRECAENGDIEAAHSDADDILCEVLKDLGYEDLITLYHDVRKWYA